MTANPFSAYGGSIRPDRARSSDSDVFAEFLDAMEAAGIVPAEPIASRLAGGQLVRFQCKDDRAGRANAWAVLHLDERPAGAFGSWKLQISEKWRSGNVASLSPQERRDLAARHREEKERREAEKLAAQKAAQAQARDRWARSGPVDPAHPYLVAKGIPGEGLRQCGQWLQVPMHDEHGVLWTLQGIAPDGAKRFTRGGRKDGLHLAIGDVAEAVVIAEGYGTAAVIRRACGLPVCVAFTAGNLTATALAMRSRYPDADLVIAADDDAHLLEHPRIRRNIGIEAANEAACAVGGRVALPPRKEAA